MQELIKQAKPDSTKNLTPPLLADPLTLNQPRSSD